MPNVLSFDKIEVRSSNKTNTMFHIVDATQNV